MHGRTSVFRVVCGPNTGSPAESRSASSRKRAISAFAILMEAVSVGTWTTATASFNFDLNGPSRHGTYIWHSTRRKDADLGMSSSEVRKRVLRTLATLHAVRSAAGIQRGQTSSAEAHGGAAAERKGY